jgi:carboxypeptidase T
LQALVNKYIQFNDYTSSGPDENFGYVASGASDDWFYATLGAAGVTFELGDAFRQNCNYFEDSILPGNLKALTYAAKVSSKPYSLPKGPDIVSMIVIQEQVVNLPGAFVTVALDVSDNLLASSQALDSTQQTVTAVRIYVDLHPYDDSGNTGPLVTLTGSQLQVGVSSEGSPTTLGVATIVLDQLLDTRPGRHAIYVEAVDSDETVGPVTAAWFEILPPPPTKVPTKSPTAEPSGKPTIDPIGLVIQIRRLVYRRH